MYRREFLSKYKVIEDGVTQTIKDFSKENVRGMKIFEDRLNSVKAIKEDSKDLTNTILKANSLIGVYVNLYENSVYSQGASFSGRSENKMIKSDGVYESLEDILVSYYQFSKVSCEKNVVEVNEIIYEYLNNLYDLVSNTIESYSAKEKKKNDEGSSSEATIENPSLNECLRVMDKLDVYLKQNCGWRTSERTDEIYTPSLAVDAKMKLKLSMRTDIPERILNWYFDSNDNLDDKTIIEVFSSSPLSLGYSIGEDVMNGLIVRMSQETNDGSVYYCAARNSVDPFSFFTSLRRYINLALKYSKYGISFLVSVLGRVSFIVKSGSNFVLEHPRLSSCFFISCMLYMTGAAEGIYSLLTDIMMSLGSAAQNYTILAMDILKDLMIGWCSIPYLARVVMNMVMTNDFTPSSEDSEEIIRKKKSLMMIWSTFYNTMDYITCPALQIINSFPTTSSKFMMLRRDGDVLRAYPLGRESFIVDETKVQYFNTLKGVFNRGGLIDSASVPTGSLVTMNFHEELLKDAIAKQRYVKGIIDETLLEVVKGQIMAMLIFTSTKIGSFIPSILKDQYEKNIESILF